MNIRSLLLLSCFFISLSSSGNLALANYQIGDIYLGPFPEGCEMSPPVVVHFAQYGRAFGGYYQASWSHFPTYYVESCGNHFNKYEVPWGPEAPGYYSLYVDWIGYSSNGNCQSGYNAITEQCKGNSNVDWNSWDNTNCTARCKLIVENNFGNQCE